MTEKNFFQRLISNIDWFLIVSVFALLGIGLAAIYSAGTGYGIAGKYIPVQVLAICIGLAGMFLLISFNYQYYRQLDKFVYIISILMLIAVLVFGTTIRGTKGWFNFGFASFQPVELAKIMYILVLSSFLDKKSKEAKKTSFLISACAILMGHIILIMMQPDFSSTLSYFPITIVLLFVIGVSPFYLLCMIVFGSLAAGIPLLNTFVKLQVNFTHGDSFWLALSDIMQSGLMPVYISVGLILLIFIIWWFLWKLRIRMPVIYPIILSISIALGCVTSIPVDKSLKDYQRKRLIVFLNPKVDPRGSGYNIIQSKIAIGSGKFSGKGFVKGTQTQLGFLPEQHTDFIFSVIGEEGGWLLSQLTLLLYFFFIWRALIISRDARDRYGSLVAIGIATMFAFYAFINIGMVMGIMPVTGMPLPLLSYGGSSMVSSLFAIGILGSISIRKHTYY